MWLWLKEPWYKVHAGALKSDDSTDERGEMEGDESLSCTPRNILRIFAEANLSPNLRVLGSQLGLETFHLDEIEHLPFGQRTAKLLDTCSKRLQPLSWSLLVGILRRPALKERTAADYIEHHCLVSGTLDIDRSSDSFYSAQRPALLRSLSSSTSSQEDSLRSTCEAELTIPNVVNTIVDVINWRELGLFLGLEASDIEAIHENYSRDPREYHQRLVERWFAQDPERSWEKLHKAMVDASAAQMHRRGSEISYTSLSIQSLSPLTPTSPTDIKSQIDRFEEWFEDLQLGARKEIEQRKHSVEKIKERLTVLPSTIMKQHHQYVIEIITQQCGPFPSVLEMFMYLNLHCWNFFEYNLLKYVIEKFCSSTLRSDMARYARQMQWFQQETTVFDFIKYGRCRLAVEKPPLPPRFKELVLEEDIDLKSYTLADLERFRLDSCSNLKLSECALHLYSIRHNCIIVQWIFPEELTEQFVCFYCSEGGRELLQIHHVERVTVDGQSLHSWLLLVCIKNADRKRTLSILEEERSNIYLDCQDWESAYTSLMFATEQGDVEIVRSLTEGGADINISDKNGETALIIAVKSGHREVVEILLEPSLQCQVNLREKLLGWSALHFAASRGQAEIVEMLLNPIVKANLLLMDHNDRTAFQVAQEKRHMEVVELLQPQREVERERRGSDAPAASPAKKEGEEGGVLKGIRKFLFTWPWQKNKLVTAATNGSVDEVRTLLDNKADPNAPHKRFQWTPLMYASQQGHAEVVKILLERGANPNWRAVQGWNALILACQQGFDDIVELLLNHECDPNIQTTTKGWTALHGLCRYIGTSRGNIYAKGECSDKYVRAVSLLLYHGADVRITEKSGWTPLIIASRNGLVDIVRLLVEKISTFSDVEKQKALDQTKKQDSWSALMEACAEGHTKVVEILVDAGASLTLTRGLLSASNWHSKIGNAKDTKFADYKDGASAMHIAVKAGHYDVVVVLLLAARIRKLNLNTRDKKGMTPLILATKEKKDKIVKALLGAGVDVNLQTEDEEKLTPLMIAAREGKLGLVELLMKHQANPHIRDSRNRSPRELAKNREVRAFFDEVMQQEAKKKLELKGQ